MASSARKKINLALQGGGAHGAFTWGVLETFIEDHRIEVEAVSGTSAGAINAIMVADGMARGGPKEACKRLADFWRAASLDGELPEVQRAVIDRLFSILPMEGWPVQSWFDAVSRFWSPYDLNPLNINPLKDVVERCSAPSRSTAFPTGTAAISAIPRSFRSSTRPRPRTFSWSRSTRSSAA